MTKSASMFVTASPTTPELADGSGASASARLAILGSLVVTFLARSSATTPPYRTYQAMWGFSAVMTTVVSGIYAVAGAVALLATANDVAMLLGARVVQGVSTGAAMAAVGAAMVGIGSLIAGVVVLPAGVHAGAPVAFFVGTAIAGVGFGSGFQGSLRLVLPTVQPEDRAGTMSVLYIVSYLGMGFPAVGAAELVVHGSALVDAATAYGAVVVGLAALAALGLTAPRLATRWRSATGSNPGDGWWRGALRVEPCADPRGRCDLVVPECRGGS